MISEQMQKLMRDAGIPITLYETYMAAPLDVEGWTCQICAERSYWEEDHCWQCGAAFGAVQGDNE